MPEVHHLHNLHHHLHWTQTGLQQQFINNNIKSIKKHRLTRQKEERGVRPDVQAFEFGQLLIYRHPQQSNWLFTSGKCLRINRRTTKCLEYDESDFLCQTWYTPPGSRHHYIYISSSSSSGAVARLGHCGYSRYWLNQERQQECTGGKGRGACWAWLISNLPTLLSQYMIL